MSTTIFNARVSFAPKVKTSTNGEYVLLNASKKAGKTSDGQPIYNEYHLSVWGERDVSLARNLGVGDYITFTIERERLESWTGQDGKVRPYLSGNVRTGEICAVYTNKPSAGLFAYEQEAQTRREAAKSQRPATPAPTPAPTQTSATTPVGNGLIQPVPAQQYAPAPAQQYAPAPAQQYAPPAMNGIEVPF